MTIFSYVVVHDFGFAPNPFSGSCTLATCKPKIRGAAHIGDWVMGTGSAQKSLAGRLVYVMQVGEILTFDQYWEDPRFADKVPRATGALKHAYGDNIYHHDPAGQWLQADSRHSFPDGVANPGHVNTDTSVDSVLVATRFSYFGGSGPAVAAHLRSDSSVDLVHGGRGHRSRFSDELVEASLAWFTTLEEGRIGRPADWPRQPGST